jgi:bifunctional oligoribonuclease and PAP phosphatase NrnA
MTQEQRATPSDFDAVVEAISGHERFLVVAHESPDGDAFGSMLGAALGLRALGKDVLMLIAGELPFPGEYAFLPLGEVLREPPADLESRVLLALDCANERRLGPDPALLRRPSLVLDVDHHHDNSRFGAVNLVVADASSTAEIVGELLAAVGVPLSPEIAQALYVGLVTDTGRFQYTNTTPKALRFAASLAEAGADPNGIFKQVYETIQFAKLKLLGRALERAELHAGGRLLVSRLLRSDFSEVGAEESYADGVIDILRQTEGTELVALMREPLASAGPARKVSLRSSSEQLDVSAIARQRGGGGHRQASGFSSAESFEQITEFLAAAFAATGAPGAGDAAARA